MAHVNSAYQLKEYRKWAATFALFPQVDFSEVDRFLNDDLRDLRNMREHIVEYFTGGGRARNRWVKATADSFADASTLNGKLIGGRLDWSALADAAKHLLPQLMREPQPDVAV